MLCVFMVSCSKLDLHFSQFLSYRKRFMVIYVVLIYTLYLRSYIIEILLLRPTYITTFAFASKVLLVSLEKKNLLYVEEELGWAFSFLIRVGGLENRCRTVQSLSLPACDGDDKFITLNVAESLYSSMIRKK